jgi:CrcB protein
VTPVLAAVVVVSGGLAAVLRYAVTQFAASRANGSWLRRFPWAVLIVNAAGSLLAGCAAGFASAGIVSADARLVLVTGVAGGLTTFSTFSVETVQLVQTSQWRKAAVSVALNLVLGIGLAALGYWVASALVR